MLQGEIYVRREFRLEPIAMQPWDYVKWDWNIQQGWSSSTFDLGFSVEFCPDGATVPEIQSQRIRMTDMHSDFIAQSKGKLTLVWSNEHSWFYNKTLQYEVQLPARDLDLVHLSQYQSPAGGPEKRP